MIEQPDLHTQNLVLRAYTLADAGELQRLIGAREVADTTINIPHPYTHGMAEQWISAHAKRLAQGAGVSYAVRRRVDDVFVGGMGLEIARRHNRAELGYWIGMPFWGQGYATEAASAVLAYAFDELKLNRVVAEHFSRNPASGKVMQKIGMRYEGTLRQQMLKWDKYEDAVVYGLLAAEWREHAGAMRIV